MLEGLNAIDWDIYRGAYSGAEAIPDNIRALLSEDNQLRKAAQSALRADISHQTSIYPATGAVIPFIIEILASKQSPDPLYLLDLLYTLTRNAREQMGYYDYRERDYGFLEAAIDVFQKVLDGYSAYREYLNHDSAEIRSMALRLLTLNRAKVHSTRVLLRRMLRKEKVTVIKALILLELSEYMDVYALDEHRGETVYNAYKAIVISYLGSEHERLTRLAAAVALRRKSHDKEITKQILDILFDALKIPIRIPDQADFEVQGDEINCTEIHYIIDRIARFGIYEISTRLNDATLSPLHVHYIGRALLDLSFERISPTNRFSDSYWNWGRFDGWLEKRQSKNNQMLESIYTVDKIEYKYHKTGRNYIPGIALNKEQRHIIKTLVDCELFWQIKTNVFSFFYGLPDEPEELRKLL